MKKKTKIIIKVDSYYMYKLKSGYFISASSKYVEELKKQK